MHLQYAYTPTLTHTYTNTKYTHIPQTDLHTYKYYCMGIKVPIKVEYFWLLQQWAVSDLSYLQYLPQITASSIHKASIIRLLQTLFGEAGSDNWVVYSPWPPSRDILTTLGFWRQQDAGVTKGHTPFLILSENDSRVRWCLFFRVLWCSVWKYA